VRLYPLLVQALAVAIVVIGPKGRARFDTLGVQFVIIAAVYHGLTEALQLAFPDDNFYRRLVNDDDLTGWLWTVSGSLLAFACAYTASSRLRTKESKPIAPVSVSLQRPWLWLVLTVPFYLYSVIGVTAADSYWAGGLSQQFLLLCMVMTSVACVQAGAPPVLMVLVQIAAASLLASRLSVLASVIMLLTALYASGKRIRFREVLYSGLLVALVAVTISMARASVGREQLLGGVSDRADGIVKGSALLASGNGVSDLIDDVVYRFDGNSFATLIYNAYQHDRRAAGIWPFVNDLWVAVPAFLNPSKADADETRRNDGTYITAWFALPESVSFVPMQLGIVYGSTGVILFPLVLALCGGLVERIDGRLGPPRSSDGLIVKIALCQANVFMETGFISYPLVLRGALVLIVVTRLAAWRRHATTATLRPAPSSVDAPRRIRSTSGRVHIVRGR
jgi:hypothetical protein